MKKTSYHHGNLEKALLEAGIREAQTSGSRNLGVTHLAKAVDVSPMAVYRHFANGESLKAEIAQQAREELARRMMLSVEGQTDVRRRFLSLGRTYIQFGLTEPGLFSVAFLHCDELPKREDAPSAWLVLQTAIHDLCDAGLIERDDVDDVTALAWSSVHGFASLARESDPPRPRSSDEAIDNFLERIWAGIVRRPN